MLASADLVVDATGEEAVSIALNQRLVDRRPSGPAAVHVWLAGNGAAAQCLFVDHKGEGACLKCLRPAGAAATRPDWPLAPGAGLREAPAACGEAAFVPYGVAAPAIAAGLALKVCLDRAGGNTHPAMRTIRIDAAATAPVADCDPRAEAGCPACRGA